MIRKKIEFLIKPIPGKTYEIGDTVTVLWNYLPETYDWDYRFCLNSNMLRKFGGKSFRILKKSSAVRSATIGFENRLRFLSKGPVSDDMCSYCLDGTGDYKFSSGMFKETYSKDYDKKEE